MKKLLMLSAILIAMFCFTAAVSAQNNPVQFNLQMTVNKYIETTPNPITFNYGTTSHSNNAESLDGGGVAGIQWNIAYANCPFNITFAGSGPGSAAQPRFGRAEVGTQGVGIDVLNTFYQIHVITNTVVTGINGDGNWGIAAKEFPYTQSISEAPHNGQVALNMYPYVNTASRDNVPVRQTLINSGFTNDMSADAGDYTCSMVITLAAL
jgi:hypothetical protein